MRNVRLFRALLGVDQRTVIEDIELEEAEEFEEAGAGTLVVARVRPRSGVSRRCGLCGRRGSWYDRGESTRRWRGLDWGKVQVVLEAEAPRVNCPTHVPTVVAVPWAAIAPGIRWPSMPRWPAECDLMAQLEGLELEGRFADWRGSPFTGDSENHVSVWRKPTPDEEGGVP